MSNYKRILSGDDILTLAERTFSFDVEVYCKEVRSFTERLEQAVLQSEQVQALCKDAERYRWLRDMIKNHDLTIAKVGSWSLESWSGDDPDHYIDVAMEKQE